MLTRGLKRQACHALAQGLRVQGGRGRSASVAAPSRRSDCVAFLLRQRLEPTGDPLADPPSPYLAERGGLPIDLRQLLGDLAPDRTAIERDPLAQLVGAEDAFVDRPGP